MWSIGNLVEGQIGGVSEHYAEGGPHLPLHHQRATDGWGSRLGGIDGDRGGFRPDTQTQAKSSDEQVPPGVGEGLPEDGDGGDQTGDEDGAPPAKPMIEGHRQPATNEGTTQIRSRIDQAKQPGGA